MQEALVVRRETHVSAPPAAVFALLTDPELILRWMGTEAQLEPQPGGLYLLNITGARIVRGSPDTSDPGNPATGPRIVVFRRPLLARADDEDELSELVFDVVVEEFAEILGVEPEVIDPGYGEIG